jgi:DNA-binding winged helix-turn-helix (wHTH) protein
MKTLSPVDESVFRFGPFELRPARRLLIKDGRAVKVGSRALDLLVALVQNAGTVIEKDELISRVWANVVVEDTNLRVHIAALRRLLGDDGLDSRYIVHVARRGYVFVAPLVVTDRPATRPESIFAVSIV